MESDDDLGPDDRRALLRWRLALGPAAEKAEPRLSLTGLAPFAGEAGVDPARVGELDEALSFVYAERKGKLSASRPYVPRWLAALRDFFRKEVVAVVQKDAIERRGLIELLFEPETMPLLEKNVELAATLIAAKNAIPDKAKDLAREIVREIADEVRKKLESETRTTLLGALRRSRQSPLRLARNLDFSRTIRENLKGWDAARQRLVPERLRFSANQQKKFAFDLVILVDQSGSMAESVVFAAVMAAIFASIDALRTKLVLFDTEIVDATPWLADPVDVLFSAELGGGTDINRAVAYAQANLIERPDKTILLLISDLFEGGVREELVQRMRQLVESQVRPLCLLSLSDAGRPSFDHELARELAALSVPCFACTPRLLPQVLDRVLRGQGVGDLVTDEGGPQGLGSS